MGLSDYRTFGLSTHNRYHRWPPTNSSSPKMAVPNAHPEPTSRRVLPRGEYDRRYRQGSCVLCRMLLWAERYRLFPNYFWPLLHSSCCPCNPPPEGLAYNFACSYVCTLLKIQLKVPLHRLRPFPSTPFPLCGRFLACAYSHVDSLLFENLHSPVLQL